MLPRPPRSTRTYTLLPLTTLFPSVPGEQPVYVRHLTIESIECVDQRPTSGKGRGLFRWASALRRGVAKFDRQIVGQEQAPAPALRDLNQQFGCDCAFEQLARARDTKPKVIGDRLRREQRLMDGESQEPGQGAWPELRAELGRAHA